MIAAYCGLYFGRFAVHDWCCWGHADGFHLQILNRYYVGFLPGCFRQNVDDAPYYSVQTDLFFQSYREYVAFAMVKSDPEVVLGAVATARSEAAFLEELRFHYRGSDFVTVGTSFGTLVLGSIVYL